MVIHDEHGRVRRRDRPWLCADRGIEVIHAAPVPNVRRPTQGVGINCGGGDIARPSDAPDRGLGPASHQAGGAASRWTPSTPSGNAVRTGHMLITTRAQTFQTHGQQTARLRPSCRPMGSGRPRSALPRDPVPPEAQRTRPARRLQRDTPRARTRAGGRSPCSSVPGGARSIPPC
jgi:hypothetical protein